ncbi:MAG: non-canonical purine NTP pyrophosphatase [Gaiellaceae bacterium]
MDGVTAALCSTNEHKARELERLLPGWTIERLAAHGYPAEDGDSYYENARAKARFGRRVGPPDVWMIGEDSGVEVKGLGGRPGIWSARFGGGDPVGRLLVELDGVEDRRARYVSEIVVLSPEREEFRGSGVLEGRIAGFPAGNEGFGYDPVFIPEDGERTVAELGDEWKRGNSHRARAAAALLAALTGSAAGAP